MKYLFIFFITASFICCKNEKGPKVASAESTKTQGADADYAGIYQHYHATPTSQAEKDENALIDYIAHKNIQTIRTANAVYIHEFEKGKGQALKWGDNITVDYKGYFLDGKEFDSSYGRGEPISFAIGTMNAGWNDALPFLHEGSKASIMIPSKMGYGEKGFPGFIGPNMNLVFNVHILKLN